MDRQWSAGLPKRTNDIDQYVTHVDKETCYKCVLNSGKCLVCNCLYTFFCEYVLVFHKQGTDIGSFKQGLTGASNTDQSSRDTQRSPWRSGLTGPLRSGYSIISRSLSLASCSLPSISWIWASVSWMLCSKTLFSSFRFLMMICDSRREDLWVIHGVRVGVSVLPVYHQCWGLGLESQYGFEFPVFRMVHFLKLVIRIFPKALRFPLPLHQLMVSISKYAWRWNVTISMVGLKTGHLPNKSHKNNKPQKHTWEYRRRRWWINK